MNRKLKLILIAGLLALSGCATPAVVFISNSYNASAVKRVALINFSDYPNLQGSGEVAAATFEKYLMGFNYSLVERRQVNQILKDHVLNLSGAVDQTTIRSVGKLLGVDALVFGGVTSFSDVRQQTVMTPVVQVQSDPVYGKVESFHRDGDGGMVKTTQNVVTSYTMRQTSQYVPETQLVPAVVGMSVRLVDVETGEVLWSASASGSGDSLSAAAENASAAILKTVNAKLAKQAKVK